MSGQQVKCPKCRRLGLGSDCAEPSRHGGGVAVTIKDYDDGTYELDVTLRFAVPITSTLPLDPHDMATHMRESWIGDDTTFRAVLAEVVEGEYDLEVKPFFAD